MGEVSPVPEMVDADRAQGSRLLTGPTGLVDSLVARSAQLQHWIGEGLLIGLENGKGREWLENSARSNSRQFQVNAASDKPILYDAPDHRQPRPRWTPQAKRI